MAKNHQYKLMSKEELMVLQERNWMPISLAGEAIPSWLQNIPEERLMAVWGSGTYWDMQMVRLGNEVIDNVVAGYDVFRHDPKDEPFGYPVNKDHYIVFMDSSSDDMYLIIGPEKDDDHWLAELPKSRPEIEITELPSNDEDDDE